MVVAISILSIVSANLLWQLLLAAIKNHRRKMYMSTSVTLDEFLNRDRDHINQVVYKVDGNFNGNITGDNVTVILMGDGNFVGDIDSKDGEVVLIKGNINGNVKANKIVCPTKPTEQKHKVTCESCRHYCDLNRNYYWCTEDMSRQSKIDLDICGNYISADFALGAGIANKISKKYQLYKE